MFFFFFLSFIYIPNSVCFGYKINYMNTIDKHLFITHIEKVSCNRKKEKGWFKQYKHLLRWMKSKHPPSQIQVSDSTWAFYTFVNLGWIRYDISYSNRDIITRYTRQNINVFKKTDIFLISLQIKHVFELGVFIIS